MEFENYRQLLQYPIYGCNPSGFTHYMSHVIREKYFKLPKM